MTDVAPLEVLGARKSFGDTVAVDGVDLTLAPEEIVAVVGPSGCGKSTLLRAIGGLEAIDAGTIRLGGELADDGRSRIPPERRSVGLVFQEHALFPHLSVDANVGFGLRGWSRQDAARRVADMLAVVSLDGYAARYPHELSGGERQRVALARALAPSPALMLFDEPFASLDRNLRDDLRRHVVDALRATGTAGLIVTHDQHEALSMGDRIAVMRSGRIRQLDTPDSVFHRPADRFIASFMGDASFLEIERAVGGARTSLGLLAEASADAVVAMVRPDDVEFIGRADGVGGEQAVRHDVDVVSSEYRGTHWLVTTRLPGGEEVLASASHLLRPEPGDTGSVVLLPGHRQVPLVDSD